MELEKPGRTALRGSGCLLVFGVLAWAPVCLLLLAGLALSIAMRGPGSSEGDVVGLSVIMLPVAAATVLTVPTALLSGVLGLVGLGAAIGEARADPQRGRATVGLYVALVLTNGIALVVALLGLAGVLLVGSMT